MATLEAEGGPGCTQARAAWLVSFPLFPVHWDSPWFVLCIPSWA